MSSYSELADELLNAAIYKDESDASVIYSDAAAALRELEAERDRLREALETVASDGCNRFTTGPMSCFRYLPDEAPCDACVARAALEGK